MFPLATNLINKRVVRLSEPDSQGNRTVEDAGNVALVIAMPNVNPVGIYFLDDDGILTAVEKNDQHSYRYFEPASNHKVGDTFIGRAPEPAIQDESDG